MTQDGFALGLTGRAFYGFGIAARWPTSPRWQLGAAVLSKPFVDYLSLGLGLKAMRALLVKHKLRAYALANLHYLNQRERFEKPFDNERFQRRFDALTFGAGFGVELRDEPLAFVLELPLTCLVALSKDTHLRFPGRVNVGMFPHVAILYYFGQRKR